MKIRHNIQRYWRKLEWYILETLFEEGERKGDEKPHYTSDWIFRILSDALPELCREKLYVHWRNKERDNRKVSHVYESEENAKRVLAQINEFTIKEKEDNVFVTKEGNLAVVQGDKTFYFVQQLNVVPKDDGEWAKENLEPVENLEEQVQQKSKEAIELLHRLFPEFKREEEKEETIEIDGKTYRKKEIEDRLKWLEPIE